MAVTRLTCPECQTVLRPAKPIPEGKPVKCPECGARFRAAEGEGEDEPAPKKPKKAAGGGDAPHHKPKKAADGKAAKKPPARPAAAGDDDDSEEGGVYRFVDAGVAEEEDEDKPDIEYAPDMSTKDLRGPAHMALVHPSNCLIAMGGIGFFGWVALIIVHLIPVVFPVDTDSETDKTKPPKPVIGIEHGLAAVNDDKDPPIDYVNKKQGSVLATLFMLEPSSAPRLPPAIFFVYLFLMFLGMVYSGFLTFGAVKIQNLEGYGWGIASCILAIISVLNLWGLASCTKQLGAFLMGILFDDQRFIWGVMIGLMSIEMLICTAIGVWGLLTMLSEKVVKGYEYKPE
jgi:hypothetical protein